LLGAARTFLSCPLCFFFSVFTLLRKELVCPQPLCESLSPLCPVQKLHTYSIKVTCEDGLFLERLINFPVEIGPSPPRVVCRPWCPYLFGRYPRVSTRLPLSWVGLGGPNGFASLPSVKEFADLPRFEHSPLLVFRLIEFFCVLRIAAHVCHWSAAPILSPC